MHWAFIRQGAYDVEMWLVSKFIMESGGSRNRDSLKTSSLSTLPWSFDWISPIFGEMQSNDHGGVLNEEVFKLPRFFEHPDSIRKYDFNGFRQSQAKSIEMRTEGARSVRVFKPCRFP